MASTHILLPLHTPNPDRLSSEGDKFSSILTQKKTTRRQHNSGTSTEGKIVLTKRERGRKESLEDQENRQEEFDPSSYRNSIFHNICTAVLAEGYHEAFTELFTLVEQQRDEHKEAGPAAILLSPLIDNEEEKLKFLTTRLMDSESAKRLGDLDVVYMNQREIALHFEQSGDRWLADHFHSRCLETGSMIKGDNKRKEGEAHFHVALAYEHRGELQEASEHLNVFYQLAKSHNWHTETGESLYPIVCEHLRRVYTSMGEKAEESDVTIDYLTKAHSMAKESGDTYQEGVSCYRLGCANEKIKDYDAAIKNHKGYLERCRYHGDQVGVSSAYEALSRCYEQKGDIENAVKCLELYVSVAEGTEPKEPLAKACSTAGIMFNTLGDYEKAVEYFSKCYEICCSLGNAEAIESARVHYGIAQTHYRLTLFSKAICNQSDLGVRELVKWKRQRVLPSHDVTTNEEKEIVQEDITSDTQTIIKETEEKEQLDTSSNKSV